MPNQIVNGAPMVVEYGTQDLSTTQLPRVAEAIPQHLPKFFTFAQKGDLNSNLVSGAEVARLYGDETLNLRGKFTTHTTPFINAMIAQGNAVMLKRVVPADIGPEASIVAWLDVLPTQVDLYRRLPDGSIKTNALGEPEVTGQAAGFKVKWVVSHYSSVASAQQFGQQTSKPGDQFDPVSQVQSTRYPIWEVKASSLGSAGNLSGLRMWAPTTKSVSSMPTKMMSIDKAYPYFVSVIRKADAQSTAKQVETLFGEQKLMFTFKTETEDPLTTKRLYLGETLISSYQNLTDLRYPKQYGDFGDLKVYNTYLETLLAQFQAAEVPFLDSTSDFTASVEDKHLFNLVSGMSSQGIVYHSFVFVDSTNTVRLTEYNNIFAAGGTDGTMSDAVFSELVKAEMEAYLDPNNEVQEIATNVESIIYDTGFPLATKYALCNFIGVRKDTFVVLSTYTAGQATLEASEEHAIAIALRTRAQMYPESDYFGTPVMRAMIMGRSGKIRNSLYTKEVPLTYEVAVKSAKYMGASNGAWKNGSNFDGAPGSVLEYMTDISITWVPASVRNRNWDVGLNWVQAFDRRSYFFPALKTVYDDDTSVLNSYTVALAIGQVNKINHAAWRQFSGVDHLTNAVLAQEVDNFVLAAVKDKFDGRYVIVPQAQFTDMDLLRGFSWTLPVKLYANNMKTVMTTYTQAFRMEDLTSGQ
jgi:hypothetical protein